MKVLCVFGKNQYGDSRRGIGTEYAAFIPALRNLGCEVIHFESWEKDQFEDFKALNNSLINTVLKERPDLLLAVQINYELWLETLNIIKDTFDVSTVCWTTDDSWKYEQFSRFMGKSFDVITTTYSSVLSKYRNDGIKNVLLTQWAANSKMLKSPLPVKKCRYPISFIGSAHGNRKRKIKELQSLGFEISCFGHGWPVGSIAAQQIPGIMRESVISLNFSNSYGENQIKARTFEVPGSGGFLLTENAPGLERFYKIGTEIEVFKGTDDLAQKLKYFLEHPNERDRIARAGYIRTKREHIYEIRLKKIFEFAKARPKKYKNNKLQLMNTSFQEACNRHEVGFWLKTLRGFMILPCILIWGKIRGPRAARRILFEISWRLMGSKTYTASGLPGRLFYQES